MNLKFPPPASQYLLSALVLTSAVSFSATLVQKAPPVRPADADSRVLIWVLDRSMAADLPRNFRTTNDPIKANKGQIPSDTGLADLRASGSGEFTADGLKLLLERTRAPVTVFDLRQETHIFVNGLPISWFATRDWANVGRSQGAIEADESARVESLKPGRRIVIRAAAAVKKPGVTPSTSQNVTAEHASTEREFVKPNHAAYVRVAVTDQCRPLDI